MLMKMVKPDEDYGDKDDGNKDDGDEDNGNEDIEVGHGGASMTFNRRVVGSTALAAT